MVAVGLDPGVRRTGYAVVAGSRAGLRVQELGVLRTQRGDLPAQLRELYREAVTLLRDAQPELVALEDVFGHVRHPGTAVRIAHARAVLCLAAAEAGARVLTLAPAEVKGAVCGNGRAAKVQVQAAVRAALGLREELDEHAADALALAATALVRSGFPLRSPAVVP